MRTPATAPTHRPPTRSRGVRSLLILAASLLLLLPTLPAAAVEDVQPARVAGETRLETAAAVADLAFPQGSDVAVVASSTTYQGALVGSALAGAFDAPVLLTSPDDLAATTAQAIQNMGVERAIIVGGTSMVSAQVEAQLGELVDTDRIGGDDPYFVAADVARTTAAVNGALPTIDGRPTVLMASGEDFADALTLSGPAHDGPFPLLLTPGGILAPQAAQVLDELDPAHVVVAGGPEAIGDVVIDDIRARGMAVTRLGGINRADTATIVADYFIDIGYFQASVAYLARGDDFADALTAGTISSVEDGPILLTATQGLLGEEAGDWFVEHCPTIAVLQVVGGTAAVSVEVANGAEGLAESCGAAPPIPPATTQVFEVQPLQALEGEAPTRFDFEVARRTDDQAFTGPLDLVLFPCTTADVTGSDQDRFADTDGDGHADGFATTDTGQARIAVVNGVDIGDTTLFRAEVGADGDIDIRLASATADCAVLVVVDGNGNGELDVDADGHPTEDYGVGKATWL